MIHQKGVSLPSTWEVEQIGPRKVYTYPMVDGDQTRGYGDIKVINQRKASYPSTWVAEQTRKDVYPSHSGWGSD